MAQPAFGSSYRVGIDLGTTNCVRFSYLFIERGSGLLIEITTDTNCPIPQVNERWL